MGIHKEIHFETEICEHLAANGWLYAEGDSATCAVPGDRSGNTLAGYVHRGRAAAVHGLVG